MDRKTRILGFISLSIPLLILGGVLIGLYGSFLEGGTFEGIGLFSFATGVVLMPVFAALTMPKGEQDERSD